MIKGKTRKRHEKRDLAGLMFITKDVTAKDIAAATGVSEHIIGKWRKEDNWDEQRQVNQLKPTKLMKRYFEQSERIVDNATKEDRMLTVAEIDMLAKLSKSISYLSAKGNDPQTIMQSLDGFLNYLSHIDLKLSQQVVEHSMNYVHSKMMERKQN